MKKAETPNRVYPKVKVRGETGLTTLLEKTEVLILRVVRSLSFTKVSVGTVHSTSDVKVSEVRSERAAVPSDSRLPKGKGGEGALNDDNLDGDKSNSRTSPILRPRAVLSSPDNDGMIGSMNRRLSERPHSTPPDPKSTKPSILTHRNAPEEAPRVKTVNTSSNIRKQTHEPVTGRSSTLTQRSPETAKTQTVHVTSPVTPIPRSPVTRPVTPTQVILSETRVATATQRAHVTRPVTPPTLRSPVTRPVTPTPKSPVTRPVTPTPRSAVTRPVTPTPRSTITRPVTPTPRSPITKPFMSAPRSPLPRQATPTQKLPVWR